MSHISMLSSTWSVLAGKFSLHSFHHLTGLVDGLASWAASAWSVSLPLSSENSPTSLDVFLELSLQSLLLLLLLLELLFQILSLPWLLPNKISMPMPLLEMLLAQTQSMCSLDSVFLGLLQYGLKLHSSFPKDQEDGVLVNKTSSLLDSQKPMAVSL